MVVKTLVLNGISTTFPSAGDRWISSINHWQLALTVVFFTRGYLEFSPWIGITTSRWWPLKSSPGNLGKMNPFWLTHMVFRWVGSSITNQISYQVLRLISSIHRIFPMFIPTSGRRFLGGELGGPKSLQSVAPNKVVGAVHFFREPCCQRHPRKTEG